MKLQQICSADYELAHCFGFQRFKLVYPLFDKPIEFEENTICVFVIERADELRKMLGMLRSQIEGAEGDFVLSEKLELLPLSKYALLVTDPFSLEFDTKRIQTKLLQTACVAGESYSEQLAEILLRLREISTGISAEMELEVTASDLDDQEALIKLMDFRIDAEQLSFPEQILEYLKLQRRFFGKRLFVFYNLKACLSLEELRLLYRMIQYEKMSLLLLEDMQRRSIKEVERTLIVDEDLCIF